MSNRWWVPALALAVSGCGFEMVGDGATSDAGDAADAGGVSDGGPSTGAADAGAPDAGDVDAGVPVQARQDIVTTDLQLDLAARTGHAKLIVKPQTGAGAVRLETEGLTILKVQLDAAEITSVPLDVSGILSVPVGADATQVTIDVDYTFPTRTVRQFDGWMAAHGVSFIWPYYCSHLFPCDSSLDDGVTFTMNVNGVEAGKTAIYPRTTTSDGPAYLPGVAVGKFEQLALGATTAGTKVSAWYDPSMVSSDDAHAGTEHYVQTFDYLEKTYGPYAFGPETGSVSVDWGSDSYGGMEFHPFVHVAKNDFHDEEVHAHEAAHAWFGDGVRLACWEDFVLSEGTVTYMAARSLAQVGGPDEWAMYMGYLKDSCSGADTNAIVLPDTCNEIDILANDIWSLVTYMKGACFYEEVADVIGWDTLDAVIGDFYKAHVGRTARMNDMIAAIEARAPTHMAEIESAKKDWLLTLACPADFEQRCTTHKLK